MEDPGIPLMRSLGAFAANFGFPCAANRNAVLVHRDHRFQNIPKHLLQQEALAP